MRRCCCAAAESHASLARLSGPHLSRYSTYPSVLFVCATVCQDAGGFVVLSKGFREEGLRGGGRFCALVTFREVN